MEEYTVAATASLDKYIDSPSDDDARLKKPTVARDPPAPAPPQYIARGRGLDVDRPRNLAKTVTVE